MLDKPSAFAPVADSAKHVLDVHAMKRAHGVGVTVGRLHEIQAEIAWLDRISETMAARKARLVQQEAEHKAALARMGEA